MESLGKIIYEGFDQANVRRTVMEAATALFEGLTPQQKARRTIRQLLPAPPNGWDAIAVDEQGNPLLTADNHNQMSIINCLEYHIRSIFFHDGRSNPKFEPGIARIAYTEIGVWPEDLPDWRPNHPEHRTNGIRPIVNVLREISGVHSDDYDFDLNGMSGDELIARFAHGSTGKKYVNEEADGSGTDYRVVWIPNFETAKKYGHYTEDTQQWCLTEMRRYWNNYTKGNTVKMYFLIAPNVDEVEPEPGPNAPLDEYGLSLIGVGIAPDGTLDNCCTRWNHMHGGSDMSLSEEQLCKLLNVRELSDICPPFTEEEHSEITVNMEKILSFAKQNVDNNKVVRTYWEHGDYRMLGVWVDNALKLVLLKKDWTLAFPYPITKWEPDVISPLAYSVVLWYDPFSIQAPQNTDAEDGDNENDDNEGEPFAIFRFDGKYQLFTENTDGVSVDDILMDADKGKDGILSGRLYTMHEDYGDTALFDVVNMEIKDDDADIDYLPGNLFILARQLFIMTQDGYRFIVDDIARDDVWMNGDTANISYIDDDGHKRILAINSITGHVVMALDKVSDIKTISDKSTKKYPAKLIKFETDIDEPYNKCGIIDCDSGKFLIEPCYCMPASVDVYRLEPYKNIHPMISFVTKDGEVPIFDYNGEFKLVEPHMSENLSGGSWVNVFVCGDTTATMCRDMGASDDFTLYESDGTVVKNRYALNYKTVGFGILHRKGDGINMPCNVINPHTGKRAFGRDVEDYLLSNLIYEVGIIAKRELQNVVANFIEGERNNYPIDDWNQIYIMVKPGDQGKPYIFVYCPMSDKVWTVGIRVPEMRPDGVKVSIKDAMRSVSDLISYRLFAIRPDWTLYSNK